MEATRVARVDIHVSQIRMNNLQLMYTVRDEMIARPYDFQCCMNNFETAYLGRKKNRPIINQIWLCRGRVCTVCEAVDKNIATPFLPFGYFRKYSENRYFRFIYLLKITRCQFRPWSSNKMWKRLRNILAGKIKNFPFPFFPRVSAVVSECARKNRNE